MPKAILAIRTYPATLLLAILLFIATLVVTTGSLGKVGSGGGDSGDGGSGIGGTGRSGEFGGTGGPSPFFTSVEDEEHATEPAGLDRTESVATESTTELAAVETQVSPTLEIEESLSDEIEEVVEQHPLVNESQVILATDSTDNAGVFNNSANSASRQNASSPLQIVEAAQLESTEVLGEDATSTEDVQYSTVAENTAEAEPIPVSDELQNVAETVSVKLDTAPQSVDPEIDRRSLPDRIQRPELPPFQRIRPVERAAIMPPRVQPMRI